MFAASKSGKSSAGGGGTTDPYFPYVPLLLETTSTNGQQNNTFLDSSTNNFTITRNGTPTQGSITPYWPNGQWSNFFNGSSNYLSNATSGLITSAATYTVEGWLYVPSYPSVGAGIIATSDTVFSPVGFNIQILSNGKISWGEAWFSSLVTSASSLPLNQWVHFACVKTSSSASGAKIYINGTLDGTNTLPNSTYGTSSFVVGRTYTATNDYYYNGYISNLRMVNGVAVYTGNFTPPTSPLQKTQSGNGGTIQAITGSQTSLLTCQSNRFIDNSNNNFTLTVNGTPRVQAFQPFSPTASYTTALYGGSGYFGGSGNYLSIANPGGGQFDPGNTGAWTLEMWVNPQSSFYFFTIGKNISFGQAIFCYWSANTFGFGQGNGSSSNYEITISGSYPANSWYHYAVVKDSSNNVTVYINGQSRGTATNVTSAIPTGCGVFVNSGAFGDNSATCYLSNIRWVKGTAVYTANFTPPTAPVTAITNTSLLLNFTNAGIYDAAVQNNLITVGDAQASTTVSKWSPTSMKYDGTGDWLTAIDSTQLQLGTGDFTIEGWVYLSAISVAYGIISKGTATTGWSVNVTALNKLQFSYTASVLTGATSLATGTWYYFAVVRSGSATGNLKVYLNGSVDATSGGAVTDNFNQTSILYVGADRIGSSALNGYLQDVRITKAARTITTPTAAFPTR